MLAKLLARLFLAITSREMFILLGIGLAALSVPMIREQWRFVGSYDPSMTHETLHEIEGIVDGLAGILVAAGVFMESRDTIRKMASPGYEQTKVEARLNEVAHQNGMGILLVGLLMEIGTLLIGLPRRVIDTHGFEKHIFSFCTVLSILAVVILYDLVKDYLLTYRMTEEKPSGEE